MTHSQKNLITSVLEYAAATAVVVWVLICLPFEILGYLYAGSFIQPPLNPTGGSALELFGWATRILFFVVPTGALLILLGRTIWRRG